MSHTKINIDNYELFALDYLDGTLNAELTQAFEAFLAANPDVAEEFSGMEAIRLSPNNELKVETEGMKVNITPVAQIDESNYESAFIASAEGVLSAEEQAQVEAFVGANPQTEKDYKLFAASILKPNLTIAMPGKGSLKKAVPLFAYYNPQALRVAASIALLLTIGWWWMSNRQNIYSPRDRVFDTPGYDWEVLIPEDIPVAEDRSANAPATDMRAQTLPAKNDQSRTLASVTKMKLLPLVPSETHAERQVVGSNNVSMEPVLVSAWIDEASELRPASQGKAYTVKERLATAVFGEDSTPEERTALSLVNQGLDRIGGEKSSLGVSRTTHPEKDRKVFELIAGNFEFKRVTGK